MHVCLSLFFSFFLSPLFSSSRSLSLFFLDSANRGSARDDLARFCRRHHLSRRKAPCITACIHTQPSPSCHGAPLLAPPPVPTPVPPFAARSLRRAYTSFPSAPLNLSRSSCPAVGLSARPLLLSLLSLFPAGPSTLPATKRAARTYTCVCVCVCVCVWNDASGGGGGGGS